MILRILSKNKLIIKLEIVNLKDQLFSLNEKNKKLEDQNRITMNEIEKLNKKLISLIDKIINTNNNDN